MICITLYLKNTIKIIKNTKVAVKTIQKIRESDKSKQIYREKCYIFISILS